MPKYLVTIELEAYCEPKALEIIGGIVSYLEEQDCKHKIKTEEVKK